MHNLEKPYIWRLEQNAMVGEDFRAQAHENLEIIKLRDTEILRLNKIMRSKDREITKAKNEIERVK